MALFDQYVNLIRKYAHYYSSKIGVDYSELESQGFLIYCMALKKYDATKGASFITYLVWRLRTLKDYAYMYKRQEGLRLDNLYLKETINYNEQGNVENKIVSRETKPTLSQLLEEAEQSLSPQAYDLIKWILEREWEKTANKPTIKQAMKKFDKTEWEIHKAWIECKKFWRNDGVKLYA